MELPICKWRIPSRDQGKIACLSPKLVGDKTALDPSICLKCPYSNHEPVSPTPLVLKPTLPLACVHLGSELRKVNCPSCRGTVSLKVLSCSVYGETCIGKKVEGVAGCCLGCPSHQHKEGITVDATCGGIGDSLLGLCVVNKLKHDNPDTHIKYQVSPLGKDWVKEFNGYDSLGDASKVHSDEPTPGVRSINLGYHAEMEHDGSGKLTHSTLHTVPRWERYAKNIGTNGYLIPTLREELACPTELVGRVVLAPYSTDRQREWSVQHWLDLEKKLLATNYKVLIVGSEAQRNKAFRSQQLLGLPAKEMLGIVGKALCMVSTDTAGSHIGGILGKPTIVLGGGTPVQQIFGLYPRVKVLQGGLDCSGCCGGSPADERCRASCANLQTISPTQVLNLVDHIYLKEELVGFNSWVDCPRLANLRDAVLATNNLPGACAEFGTWKGGVAKLIQTFAKPETRIDLFDTWQGMPMAEEGEIHKQGDFSDCSLDSVRAYLNSSQFIYHQGLFADTCWDCALTRFRFAHIDCDYGSSLRDALEFFPDRMVEGGIMVFDDFGFRNCPKVAPLLWDWFGDRLEPQKDCFQAIVRF